MQGCNQITPCENEPSVIIEVHGMWMSKLGAKETSWETCAKLTLLARVSVTASNSSFNM